MPKSHYSIAVCNKKKLECKKSKNNPTVCDGSLMSTSKLSGVEKFVLVSK